MSGLKETVLTEMRMSFSEKGQLKQDEQYVALEAGRQYNYPILMLSSNRLKHEKNTTPVCVKIKWTKRTHTNISGLNLTPEDSSLGLLQMQIVE